MGQYPYGQQVTLFTTFLDENGSPTDPTTVTFRVERPDNLIVSYDFGTDPEITNPSTGYYELAYDPPSAGHYDYEIVGAGALEAIFPGSFDVTPSALAAAPIPTHGPCEPWIDDQDVAECCGADVGSDTWLFHASAISSSNLLWRLSGRQYSGICQRTVRPCNDRECGFQTLPSGYVIDHNALWLGRTWSPGVCGCDPVSKIELANYPVIDIVEVKIAGVAIDPSEYELRRHQYLIRKRDADGNQQFWPSCQIQDLDDTEEGTFSIRYLHGINPPQEGIDAARQLACEIYKSCPNAEAQAAAANCALPKNATRVTKQGITIELGALRFTKSEGWKTGMNLVDAFLNSVNPYGKQRRPAIWSPDEHLPEPVASVGT
ncbi:MAG: hypothetical protein K0S82_45 [Gaiellaceae bacterium]|jgi:hypothetical protein|nr:hypothetical protein [Gaiellaceae bacterium]